MLHDFSAVRSSDPSLHFGGCWSPLAIAKRQVLGGTPWLSFPEHKKVPALSHEGEEDLFVKVINRCSEGHSKLFPLLLSFLHPLCGTCVRPPSANTAT